LSDVSAEMPVDVTLAGQTLSAQHYTRTGANLTYDIPLHPTMPVNSSLRLQSVESYLELCLA